MGNGITTVSDLKLNPKNPRTISEAKLKQLKQALTEFGDLSGVVFNKKSGMLVGGHQRSKLFENAKVVVEKKYPKPTKVGTVAEGFIEWNGERHNYREVLWDEFKEKAANIAANKGAGEWALPELTEWMKELDSFGFNLDLTMFDSLERDKILNAKTIVDSNPEDDEVPKAPRVAKTKLGDKWVLGNHVLVCGDATDLNVFSKLLDGQRSDLTFTSPPYNANTKQMQKGVGQKLYETYSDDLASDDLASDDYIRFAQTVLSNCIAHTRQYVFWNVNYNSNSRFEYIKQIISHLELLDETIVWKKTALPVPYGLTRTWEPIFVFRCHNDKKRLGHKNVTEFNYWEISNLNALDESHRAAFPVALPSKALDLSSDAESILDPFGGSGTTMIAAEKYNKKCFMIELDPIYCDVIISRWEKFTGGKASLCNKEAALKANGKRTKS